jgi:RNA polymerase sigma-70 factor, ECF subfamily
VDRVTELALRAQRGDRDALELWIRSTQPDVWRWCASIVDRASADDLTQSTYERALRSIGSFSGESSSRTWVLAVARHVCLDEIRRRQRARRHWSRLTQVRFVEHVDPIEPSSSDDLLSRLDPDRRDAFVLTQLLGLSYAEAAHVCSVPVGTIRSRVARARADLLPAIDDERQDRSG